MEAKDLIILLQELIHKKGDWTVKTYVGDVTKIEFRPHGSWWFPEYINDVKMEDEHVTEYEFKDLSVLEFIELLG